MFGETGSALKRWAVILFIASIIGCLVLGIYLHNEMNIHWLVVLISGGIASYTLSLALYGLGQIVDNTCQSYLQNCVGKLSRDFERFTEQYNTRAENKPECSNNEPKPNKEENKPTVKNTVIEKGIVHFPTRPQGVFGCPVCYSRHNIQCDECAMCGTKYVYDDEIKSE